MGHENNNGNNTFAAQFMRNTVAKKLSASFSLPQCWNAEGIDNGVTDLSPYVSAFSPSSGTRQINVDDYANLPALVGSPARDLTKCWYSSPQPWESGAVTIEIPAGEGWTPSEGGVVRMEGVFYGSGTDMNFRLALYKPGGGDGFRLEFLANKLNIATLRDTTWTEKIADTGFASNPVGNCWFVLSLEYNFATNAYSSHCRELGSTGETQENVTRTGTVSSPTFDANAELTRLSPWIAKRYYSGSDSVGHAQLWLGTGEDAFPDGYAVTRNFVPSA